MRNRLIRWAGLLLWFALSCVAHAADAIPPVALREAFFQYEGDAGEVRVTLPDTWGARHRPTVGRATYRIPFDLAEVPRAGLTARFTRISSTRRVLLNGFPVGNESLEGNEHGIPDLLSLPAPMLRAKAVNRVMVHTWAEKKNQSDTAPGNSENSAKYA